MYSYIKLIINLAVSFERLTKPALSTDKVFHVKIVEHHCKEPTNTKQSLVH